MNSLDKTKLLVSLEGLINNWLTEGEGDGGDIVRPLVGENTAHYMAVAAMGILEAIQDQNDYLDREGLLENF